MGLPVDYEIVMKEVVQDVMKLHLVGLGLTDVFVCMRKKMPCLKQDGVVSVLKMASSSTVTRKLI